LADEKSGGSAAKGDQKRQKTVETERKWGGGWHATKRAR